MYLMSRRTRGRRLIMQIILKMPHETTILTTVPRSFDAPQRSTLRKNYIMKSLRGLRAKNVRCPGLMQNDARPGQDSMPPRLRHFCIIALKMSQAALFYRSPSRLLRTTRHALLQNALHFSFYLKCYPTYSPKSTA